MQHYREDNWASISYYVSGRCLDKPELTVAARGGSWGVGVQERSDYEVWSAGYGRGDMPISSQELSERNMASSVDTGRSSARSRRNLPSCSSLSTTSNVLFAMTSDLSRAILKNAAYVLSLRNGQFVQLNKKALYLRIYQSY